MSEETAKVERIVRGGATMNPRENPRPKPVPLSEILMQFAIPCVRAPTLAVLLTKLLHPAYVRWTKAHLANGGTEISALVNVLSGIHVSIYLSMFAFFEIFGQTEWLNQYQLPRTPAQEPTFKMKLRVLIEFVISGFLNQFIIVPQGLKLFKWFGMPDALSPLPSALKMYTTFLMAYLFNSITFACAHRLFHHGPLYRMFHKKHHEFVGTVSIAAENAHPVETILANVGPTFGACLLLGAHPLILSVWLAWRLEETYEAHSGYCFYGSFLHSIGLTNSSSAAFHDFHHTENKGAFGSEFTDHFFGTMDRWIAIGRTEGYLKLAREQHARERLLREEQERSR